MQERTASPEWTQGWAQAGPATQAAGCLLHGVVSAQQSTSESRGCYIVRLLAQSVGSLVQLAGDDVKFSITSREAAMLLVKH